jgi:hypothetical protein
MKENLGMNPLKKPKANLKRKIAKATGVPTTKSGRRRKVDRMQGYLVIGVIVLLVYLFGN